MTVVGFDGKLRRKPPADRAWLIASFVVTVAYLLVLFYPLHPRLYEVVLPFGGALRGFIFVLIPYALTLFFAVIFRVPDRSGAWMWLVWKGGGAVFLAAVVSLLLMALFQWYGVQ